jgi:hypothetical protein
MPWSADLVEGINQGVLPVRPKGNIEIDRGASGRATQRLPVGRGGVPCVLHTYVIPVSGRRRREAPEGSGGQYEENRESVVAHN